MIAWPMTAFDTMRLPGGRDAAAPDGSDVRVLLRLERGSMAHFELPSGQTSKAVTHRTVDEIWFVLSGRGEMWRAQDGVPDHSRRHALSVPIVRRRAARGRWCDDAAVVR
jgi:hypothetical protein